jgi:hypothetical protein
MSDPKDKLVLFKEILSLMIVTIGFITALMSSGVVKNIKIEPVTLIIIIAVVLFVVQLLVRMVFGEEQYVEVKKKVLYTARDFSIVLLIVIGFYFAGKYAANYNPAAPPSSQTSLRVADASKDVEKGLSTAPLKNLKKEKAPQPKPKDKDKAAAKKSDDKPSKDDDKTSKTAQKATAEHDDDQNLKTAKNEDKKDDKGAKTDASKEPVTAKTDEKKETPAAANSQMAEKKTEPVELTSSSAPAEVPKQPEKEAKTTETTTTAQAALPPSYKTSEVAVKDAKPVQTTEMAPVKEVKPEQTAETLVVKEAATEPQLNAPAAATSETSIAAETKKTEPAKPAEPVVIDVIAEDIAPAPAEPPVKNEAATSAAADAPETASASTAAKGSDEVLSYKLTKDPDEENDEDISAAGTTVRFEQTSDELREKVNNDKIVIKKEYEINKTPSGLKTAGEKVMEGGKKIFDGGANLLEKAGHGIKKQINKVIK